MKRERGEDRQQYFAPDLKWLELVLKLGKSEEGKMEEEKERNIAFSHRARSQYTSNTEKCNALEGVKGP